jgi:sulfur carrier protein
MIRVNDNWDVPWHPGIKVEDVLTACDFTYPHLVVLVNGVLVPPDEYAIHSITDGDQVKAVHVIGGG